LKQRFFRIAISILGVGGLTLIAARVVPVNGTTAGFAYLLYVLVIASTWGFPEAAAASIAATLTLNFFFLPPVGTLTIADPQNWVALFSFFATSLIASRLSTKARRRTIDAIERQQDLERLYTLGRAILLIQPGEAFAEVLCRKLADIFEFNAVALFEQRTNSIHRAGPFEFEGMESQLRESAIQGTSFADTERNRVITAIRLGSQPIAGLALQGMRLPDSVLQSIANLVAIGLERAKAQELSNEMEAARRSERLRTTLLDAMAHEFKTPLTSIRAATSALLSATNEEILKSRRMIQIADEEAARLQDLIDNALDTAQLDSERIDASLDSADLADTIRDVVTSMKSTAGDRLKVLSDKPLPPIPFDRRLVKLALKQILDNALKYSPGDSPIEIYYSRSEGMAYVDITDHGKGIPAEDQARIFERFFRGASVANHIPGSGLGLSIAQRIAQAHGGDLTVKSQPGETTFRFVLPFEHKNAA